MASAAISREFVSLIAEEMALGIETAVEGWMSQVECALTDVNLTTDEGEASGGERCAGKV
jgi:hypothetical protein